MMKTISVALTYLIFFSNIFVFNLQAQNYADAYGDDTNAVNSMIKQVVEVLKINPDSALSIATHALQLSRKLNYKKGIAISWYEMAECNRKKKADKVSEEQFLIAQQLFSQIKNDSMAADCWLSISYIYRRAGNYKMAEEYCRKHNAVFEAMPEMENGKINTRRLNGMALGYYFIWTNYYFGARYRDGIPILDTIQMLGKKQGEVISNNFNNYGITYSKLGKPDSAIYFYKLGLHYAVEQQRVDLIILFKSNIASISADRGDYAQAASYYSQVITLADSTKNFRMMASAYSGLAGVLAQKGEIAKAAEYFVLAIDLMEAQSLYDELFDVLNNAGKFYYSISNLTKAEDCYQKALALARQYQNKRNMVLAGLQLGELRMYKNNFSEALHYFENSRAIAVERENKNDVARCDFEIAEVFLKECIHYNKCSHLDSAKKLFNNSLFVFSIDSNRLMIGRCYAGLAKIAELNKDYTLSVAAYKNAIEITEQIQSRKELYDNYQCLAQVLEKSGNYADALLYYKKYVELKDVVFNETSSRQVMEIETKYETEKKNNEITLLNNRNQLQALSIRAQHASLLANELEFQKKESEVAMLNQSKEIQQLQLIQSQKNLLQRAAEAKNKTALLEIAQRDKALQQQEIELQKLIRNGIIVIAGLLIIVASFMINRFQLRKKIEKQQAVMAERRRISSDMHDDLGSGLSSIAMLSEVVKKHLTDKQDLSTLEKISQSAQQSLEKMSEIVWSLNPKNDTLESLISYIRKYTAEYFEPTTIACKIILPHQIPSITLSGEQRRNIFLVVKETLHNIIKHAHATSIDMKIDANENQLSISIHDNGNGIDLSKANGFGNGLLNMQHRMQESGGSFSIENNNGTTARLSLELN